MAHQVGSKSSYRHAQLTSECHWHATRHRLQCLEVDCTDDCDTDGWKRASSSSWFMVCRQAAIAQWWLEGAPSQKRHSLKNDRRKQWETIAGDAQRAADRGDTRELYKLARRLEAFKPTPVPGVKLKDGTLANDDDEGLVRWAEHFAAPLGGKQVEHVKNSVDIGHGDMRMLQRQHSGSVTRGCKQGTTARAKAACCGTR